MIRQFIKHIFLKKKTPFTLNKNSSNTTVIQPSQLVKKPTIWGKSSHQIDQKLLSHNAVNVCQVLQKKGFQAFIVGGAVRDLLLGKRPKDFDVATDAKPEQIRQAFRRARIIGRRFQIVHVMFGAETIEVSTFRAFNQIGAETDEHGRVLRDNVFGKQNEDGARRDFTINAMYYDPKTETVWDYHHGMEDIQAGVLRMIGDPGTRYREDPVRMLRAIRFANKLQLKIDPATLEPIAKMASLIQNVPAARLFDEMTKLLSSGQAMACIQGLRQAGLHQGTFPLLDLILNHKQGQPFLIEALRRTDERVHDDKPLSLGFLFACLLWPLTLERWEKKQESNSQKFPALLETIDELIYEQSQQLSIPKRITADMREIWAFQPRFEKRNGTQPFRMIEHPRFRACLDFLELRTFAKEIDSELANWWRLFYDGDNTTRTRLQAEVKDSQTNGKKKPNKRKRKNNSTRQPQNAATNSQANLSSSTNTTNNHDDES